jgi:sulfofructose kinase
MTGIICVGNLVHDEVFHVDSLPASGIKTGVLGYHSRFGGPAATAALAICRLGGSASYWGRIGADPAGESAIALLREQGVDCDGVAVLPGRTLRAIVLVDKRGERSIVSDRLSLPMGAEALPEGGLGDAGIVLADTRWPAAADAIFDRARAAGIATVLDADGGAPADNARLIARADHVVFSNEGLRDFAGEGAAEALLRRCEPRPGQIFAVTQGANGSLWLIDGQIAHVPAFTVAMTDTTGCGDVFHGAYALGLCEGMAPLVAARFASAAAALKGANGHGWAGMPDRAAVEDMLGAAETSCASHRAG